MRKFQDSRTEEVFITGFARGVPESVSRQARKIIHVMVAAGALEDLTLFGEVLQWTGPPIRYGVVVIGKWHLTFAWPTAFGRVTEIKLERK